MESLIDIIAGLSRFAEQGFVEHNKRGQAGELVTYRTLHDRILRCAHQLREQGVAAGEAVFLQLPNGLSLVENFLAAATLGAVPCALAPPRALGGLEAYQERIRNLSAAFPRAHLVSDEAVGSRSGRDYLLPPSGDAGPMAELVPVADPESIAFMQLTSGTSRKPKAVLISHRAIAANTTGTLEAGARRTGDVHVSWLPLYHDMGLVGMLLCGLSAGCTVHLFRPETFVARPMSWLRTIASVPTTAVTTAPNFAYQHCVHAVSAEDAAGLDLSRWRVAGCGAERVRPETIAQFAEHFAPAGFDPRAFVPCYGLAEYTLAVTFDSRPTPPRIFDGQVSCGRPLPNARFRIQDEQGREVPEGEEGEITLQGPSLCSGYTGADEDAVLPVRDGWLLTGDLGRRIEGELVVTGRKKDTIIIDGSNLDPDEVEAIGDQVVKMPGGRCAAFSVDVESRESVVLAVEVPREETEGQYGEWADAIGERFASLFGFRLHDLVFVRRGELPKTSSGKVRRNACRETYEAGEFEVMARFGDAASEGEAEA